MKRLVAEQEVALSVGDVTVDCTVREIIGGEVALAPIDDAEAGMLPVASAGASLVFSQGGRLVMLRGAMYRADSPEDIRFAEKTIRAAPTASAEQRRKAARLAITLPATIAPLDESGEPFGEERQLITKDISIGGFAVGTGVGSFPVGTHVHFDLVLTSGAMIGGTAKVVRSASEMCGFAFDKLAPADRVRLAGFLATQQNVRVARPAGTGAPAPR